MSLFFISILPFTLIVSACSDNALWKDQFGWTCRDYGRDPRECNSKLAVSEGGLHAFEACCACNSFVDRRRDYSTCLGSCSADEDACEAECAADKAGCVNKCNEEFEESEDPGGVTDRATTTPAVNRSSNGGLETWVIIVIVAGIVVLICLILIILYCLCIPQDEGTCQDEQFTQQPMLVGDCDAPCDAPCSNQYDMNAPSQMPMTNYGPAQRYP